MDLVDMAAEIAEYGAPETAWQMIQRWAKETTPLWAEMISGGPQAVSSWQR